MESTKMVLMNLLSGQQWQGSNGEQTYRHRGEEEGEGDMYADSNMGNLQYHM